MLRVTMLVLTLALVGSGTLLAPGTAQAIAQEATPEHCQATTADENRAIVQRWYDAIDAGDVEAFDDVMAPVVVQHAADFANAHDLDDVKANFGPFLAAFPDLHHEIDEAVASDDYVAIRVIGQGTHQGEFMGIPATGNDVSWSAIAIYRIECGKIAEHWSEVDAIGRLQALGAIPEIIPPVAATHPPSASNVLATPTRECVETTEAENEALVRRWFDIWNTGAFDLTAEVLHPDHVHHGSLHRATTGSEARVESLSEVRKAFPDYTVAVDLIFSEGDRVAVRWTATGTHEGDYRGAPATGASTSYTTNSLFRAECGVLVEGWAEADLLSWFQQLGLIEWPPAATPVAD